MSHAYEARFAPVALGLADVIARLEPCFEQIGLVFDGEVSQLQSQGGLAVVASMETKRVSSLGDVARVAQRWWGVSLFCISSPLAEALGRSEAMEVYLRILTLGDSQRVLVYNESSSAFHARADSDELTAQLTSTLASLSAALGADLAIYAEEDPELGAPSLDELKQRLTLQAQSSAALAWHAVVKDDLLTLTEARGRVQPWSERVRLSTSHYVVLPFLSIDT